jgi:hypothetical protein
MKIWDHQPIVPAPVELNLFGRHSVNVYFMEVTQLLDLF